WMGQHVGLEAGAMSLAVFHTVFISVGVVVFMPFVSPFARVIARLLPERKEDFSRHLDPSAVGVPAVALEASQRTLESITHQLVEVQRGLLKRPADEGLRAALQRISEGLNDALQFIARLPPLDTDP